MAEIRVREAEPQHAEAIGSLLQELGYELSTQEVVERLREYDRSGGRVWIAFERSKVVGFLSFQTVPFFHAAGSWGRITAMCVARESRRLGAGQRLLEVMEATAREMGCAKIEVTSGDHRDDAHAFYEAAGYARSHQRFLKRL